MAENKPEAIEKLTSLKEAFEKAAKRLRQSKFVRIFGIDTKGEAELIESFSASVGAVLQVLSSGDPRQQEGAKQALQGMKGEFEGIAEQFEVAARGKPFMADVNRRRVAQYKGYASQLDEALKLL